MANSLVDGMGKINFSHPIADCQACALGKLKRKPISKQPVSRALASLDLVHSNVCGPMEVSRTGGVNYFALVINNATRYVFVLFLKNKSNLSKKLEALLNYLRNNKGRSRLECVVIHLFTNLTTLLPILSPILFYYSLSLSISLHAGYSWSQTKEKPEQSLTRSAIQI